MTTLAINPSTHAKAAIPCFGEGAFTSMVTLAKPFTDDEAVIYLKHENIRMTSLLDSLNEVRQFDPTFPKHWVSYQVMESIPVS
jgi:hypothetical protein